MKKQKKQNRYQEKVDWDDMTIGELSHHIGKKMTEKVVKSKKTYTRKTKHKNKGIAHNGTFFAPKRSSVRLRYPPQILAWFVWLGHKVFILKTGVRFSYGH